MAIAQLLREARHSLSDNRQLVYHRTPDHPVRLERLRGLALDELGNLVCRRDDVLKQEAFTPHR